MLQLRKSLRKWRQNPWLKHNNPKRRKLNLLNRKTLPRKRKSPDGVNRRRRKRKRKKSNRLKLQSRRSLRSRHLLNKTHLKSQRRMRRQRRKNQK